METKFTPGPWGWWPNCCGEPGGIVTQERGQHVARPVHFERAPEVSAANARLIAAAPELYEVAVSLNRELDAFWNGDRSDAQVKRIEAAQQQSAAAIAKALGGTAG